MMKFTTISFKIAVITLMLAFVFCTSQANNKTKEAKLQSLFQPKGKTNYKKYFRKSKNELEGTASVLFLGYKSFLSSQDMASCVFAPSCSVYAIQSLQYDNPIKAYLKIFDRLSRCHPLIKPGEYPYLQQKKLFYDPAY